MTDTATRERSRRQSQDTGKPPVKHIVDGWTYVLATVFQAPAETLCGEKIRNCKAARPGDQCCTLCYAIARERGIEV